MQTHVLVIPSYYPAINAANHGSFFRDQALATISSEFTLRVLFPERITSRPSAALIKQLARFPEYTSVEKRNGKTLEEYRRLYFNFLRTKAVLFPKKGDSLKADERELFIQSGLKAFKNYRSRHGNPDLIHTHVADPGGLLALRISESYGIPYVITEHYSGYGLGKVTQAEVDLIRPVFESAEKRIAVGSFLGKSIESVVGDAFQPWTVVPNVLSSEFEQNIPQQAHSKKSDEVTFLNVANLNKNKNQDLLIRAFAEAFTSTPSVRLRIGGGGPEESALKQLINELGMEGQITLLGVLSREECREEMLKSDVFVLSSLLETFGVVLIEAWACGKPVIATRCGGPNDTVTDQNGLLVEPGNQQEMSDAMVDIISRIDEYDSQDIRDECLSRYGTEQVGERIRTLYRESIERLPKDLSEKVV